MSGNSIPDDELEYEDFDDVPYTDPADDLDAVDLDSLDESLAAPDAPAEPSPALPPAPAAADSLPRAPEHARHAAPLAAPPAPSLDEPAPDTVGPAAAAGEKPEPDPPAASVLVDVPPSPAVAVDGGMPDEPVSADTFCYVLLAPPTELNAEILALRDMAAADDLPPPGVILGGPYLVLDADGLLAALQHWARKFLPLAVERSGVLAEVIGMHQYVAGWMLEPAGALRAAQHSLQAELGACVEPTPDLPAVDAARLVVADGVPPERYPPLIARMQREFEPLTWQGGTLYLAQRDAAGRPGAWGVTEIA